MSVTGMPRLDHLLDDAFIRSSREKLFAQHPEWKGKKLLLYAPTFRGNIYEGMKQVPIDLHQLMKKLGSGYALLYKLHPLLKHEELSDDRRIYNMNDADLHELFCVADVLISDFSSIIFDFSLLDKQICYYVPDLDQYMEERGCFVDYVELTQDCLASDEDALAELILSGKNGQSAMERHPYMEHRDGHNLDRVLALIDDMIN